MRWRCIGRGVGCRGPLAPVDLRLHSLSMFSSVGDHNIWINRVNSEHSMLFSPSITLSALVDRVSIGPSSRSDYLASCNVNTEPPTLTQVLHCDIVGRRFSIVFTSVEDNGGVEHGEYCSVALGILPDVQYCKIPKSLEHNNAFNYNYKQ